MSLFDLNIHTVIVLLSFGNFIAAAILIMYKRGFFNERSYVWFMLGKCLQGFAWPFLSMRGEISDLTSVYLGNSILFAGFALEALALTVLNRREKRWEYIYSILAAAGIILFLLFADTPNLRVGFASSGTLLLFLPASVEMVRTHGNSRLRLTVGILYGVFSFFLVFRSWYGFFYRGEFALMTPGFIQNISFVQLFILLFTGGIGFLLMLKEEGDLLLAQSEEKYRTLVENANEAIVIIQNERIVFANRRMSDILSISDGSLKEMMVEKIIHPDDRELVMGNHIKRLKGEELSRIYDFRLLGGNGEDIWVTISASRIQWGGDAAVMALLTDVTERKNMEKEREKIISDLQKALSDVKALSGLLPICSNCKKIRDDRGYWSQIEVYIRDHSEADFSHSLCPDCVKKLYPAIQKKISEG